MVAEGHWRASRFGISSRYRPKRSDETMTTQHFHLAYKIRPVDRSEGVIALAKIVGVKLLDLSVDGWNRPDPTTSSFTGALEVGGQSAAAKRDEITAHIHSVFSRVLADNDASFDVVVHIEVLVDQLGSAILLEV